MKLLLYIIVVQKKKEKMTGCSPTKTETDKILERRKRIERPNREDIPDAETIRDVNRVLMRKIGTSLHQYAKICRDVNKLKKDLASCLHENMVDTDDTQNFDAQNYASDAKMFAAEGDEELIENLSSFLSPNPTEFQKKLFCKVIVEHSFVQDTEAIYPIALIDEWYTNLITLINERCHLKGKPLKINFKNENSAVFSKRLKEALIALGFSFSFIRAEKQRCINGISFRWIDPSSKIKRIAPRTILTSSQKEEIKRTNKRKRNLQEIYDAINPLLDEWFIETSVCNNNYSLQ